MNIQKFNLLDFLERYNENPVENLSLFDVLEELPMGDSGVWLAGGALRRTIIGQALTSDFDFFFSSKAKFEEFKADLIDLGAKKKSSTEHQETFLLTPEGWGESIEVQLIKITYYNNVNDLLDSFDFTITQFAYDGMNLYCGEFSLFDLTRKRLAIHKITYGVASLRRLIKYTKQGFTACSGCMAEFLEIVANNPDVIQAEIKYID